MRSRTAQGEEQIQIRQQTTVSTALMAAAQDGHEQCALALIKAGANVNATEEDDYTALIVACQNGHEQCARALLEAGAAVDATQETGRRR